MPNYSNFFFFSFLLTIVKTIIFFVDLKESLEKQKDAFAEEKHKLMVTIQKLESETSELIKEFRKQNDSFKEGEEILKSREQALLRDREIFIEQTSWERERLQVGIRANITYLIWCGILRLLY